MFAWLVLKETRNIWAAATKSLVLGETYLLGPKGTGAFKKFGLPAHKQTTERGKKRKGIEAIPCRKAA